MHESAVADISRWMDGGCGHGGRASRRLFTLPVRRGLSNATLSITKSSAKNRVQICWPNGVLYRLRGVALGRGMALRERRLIQHATDVGHLPAMSRTDDLWISDTDSGSSCSAMAKHCFEML